LSALFSMSSVSPSVISSDLDYLISEQPTELTGVTPSSLTGKKWRGSLQSMEAGYDVEISGIETTVDTEFCFNASKQATNPTKGAVLESPTGERFKVAEIKDERIGILSKLYLTSQYQRER
jgi:hypothetical protein